MILLILYAVIYCIFSKVTNRRVHLLLVLLPFVITYGMYLFNLDISIKVNLEKYLVSILGFITFFFPILFFYKKLTKASKFFDYSSYYVPYSNFRFWLTILILVNLTVIVSMIFNGIPVLSNNPNLERLYFSQNNGISTRVINYVIPFLSVYCLYLCSRQRNVALTWQPYLIYLLLCITPFLLGNKGSVLILSLLYIASSRTINGKKMVNESFLLVVGLVSLVSGFILHGGGTNSAALILSISNRLQDFSGVDVVFESFIPIHGYMYGKTFLYEMNSIFSLLGISSGLSTQTTGNYVARWYVNGDESYLFEYVFSLPIIGYINFGYTGVLIFSLIFGTIFMYSYVFYLRCRKITSIWWLMVSYTMLMIFVSGKPGSFLVGNIMTFTALFIFSQLNRLFFKQVTSTH
ncbi:O-antigen polymerase [Escherichia coli]|uniref:O-antigen polymerase n=1 Tax=Escherichia coli TaxID=562 RepID=UPI0004D7C2CC|nr:O-antigen polymerase [Escherichia coli]KDX89677.1 putative membrane protein [Escherichia coli 2-316-03_S3_C1]